MSNIFNLDNPIWNILNKITDVIILSLLFIVTSVPVVTIGASLTALYYQMFRLSENTEGNIVRGYLKSFAENFKKATPVWIVCLIAGAFLAGDLYICIKMQMPAATFFMAVIFVIAVFYVMFVTYLFPLLSRCIADTKKIAFMAFMMSVAENNISGIYHRNYDCGWSVCDGAVFSRSAGSDCVFTCIYFQGDF